MVRVHVFAEPFSRWRPVPGYWFACQFVQPQLRRRRIHLRFLRRWTPTATDCDVLVLCSWRLCPANTVGTDPASREALFRFLESCRRSRARLVWCDQSDSTGTTQFEVLPYVDRYWKKQLLRDRSRYRQVFYSGRIHFDYYHRRFGFADPPGPALSDNPDAARPASEPTAPAWPWTLAPAPLPETEQHKLEISWNIGLHDRRRGGFCARLEHTLEDHLRQVLRRPPRFAGGRDARRARTVDLVAAFNVRWPRVYAQARRLALDRCAALRDLQQVSGGKHVPYPEFLALLGRAKIVLSTFGLGEICYREFETFHAGAALLMPDLSHLETWPDVYRAHETYLPVRWDFADLEQVVRQLLADEDRRRALAEQGQQTYRHCWSAEGLDGFARRLADALERAAGSRG